MSDLPTTNRLRDWALLIVLIGTVVCVIDLLFFPGFRGNSPAVRHSSSECVEDPALALVDGDDGPWWRDQSLDLQAFLRTKIENANEIRFAFSGVDGDDIPPLAIAESSELKNLADLLEVQTERKGYMEWMAPVYCRVWIKGDEPIHFELIGCHLRFGPWKDDLAERKQLGLSWDHVDISAAFVTKLEKLIHHSLRCGCNSDSQDSATH